MKIALTGRRYSQLLFVSGNLAAVAAIVSLVVLPVHAFFSSRDEAIADRSRVLGRLKSIAAQEANIQAIAADTKVHLQSGEFLKGANENVISADLQTRIKGLTDGAGTRSRTLQALPAKGAGHLRYAGARIEIFGSIQSVQHALFAIENAKPYLFIMAANMKSAQTVTRPGVPDEPVISAQLDVYGAMQPAGSGP